MEDVEPVIQIPVGLACFERGRLVKKRLIFYSYLSLCHFVFPAEDGTQVPHRGAGQELLSHDGLLLAPQNLLQRVFAHHKSVVVLDREI